MVLSPGMGGASSSFGWWDAWRAYFNIPIPKEELTGRGLADLDADDSVSTLERETFVQNARFIGFNLRLSRTWLALQVGATLGICGAVLQVLFRNPLAEPYTLGIAGGGSLGALLCIRLGWVASLAGVSSVSLCAFAGAILVVGVAWLSLRGRAKLSSNDMLLGGVATGLFCGAMMMLVTAVSNERVTFEAIRWMLGSLDPIIDSSGWMLPLILPAWLLLPLYARSLNQFRLGDDLATSRGVDIRRLFLACLLLTTLATAAVVAHCGPIGFVGLVVPQAVRLIWGEDCRILIPASATLGGAFLIVCDWGSQFALPLAGWATGRQMGGAAVPVGVVTALVGVPVLLALLRRRRDSEA